MGLNLRGKKNQSICLQMSNFVICLLFTCRIGQLLVWIEWKIRWLRRLSDFGIQSTSTQIRLRHEFIGRMLSSIQDYRIYNVLTHI